MSLLSLNSRPKLVSQSNESNNFRNNYPQTLQILPRSQIALLKFVHFRESGEITISFANNRFFFIIGDLERDARREVILDSGDYTDQALADHIRDKMNAINHQQNYRFDTEIITTGSAGFTQIQINIKHTEAWVATSSYNKGDLATVTDVYYIAKKDNTNANPTTSPDDWERLIRGGKWTLNYGALAQGDYLERDSAGLSSIIGGYTTQTEVNGDMFAMSMERGMLVHDGSFYTETIPLRWNDTMGSGAQTYSFLPLHVGVIDLDFDILPEPPDTIDFGSMPLTCYLSNTGHIYFSNDIGVVQKEFDLNGKLPALTDKADVLSTVLRLTITTIGSDGVGDTAPLQTNYYLVQLEYSTDNGNTYQYPANSGGAIQTVTKNGGEVYQGTVYISESGDFQSKNAPLKPVLAIQTSDDNEELHTFGCVDLVSQNPRAYSDGGTASLTFSKAVGSDPEDFVATITDGATTTQLNLSGSLVGADRLLFTYPGGTFSYDPNAYTFSQVEGATTTTWTAAGDGLDFVKVRGQFSVGGIFNPIDTNDAIVSLSAIKSVDKKVITDGFQSDLGVTVANASSNVGGSLSKPVALYLGKLSYEDHEVHPDYVPLEFVADSTQSGTVWKTIGSSDAFILNNALSSGQIYLSDAPLQRLDGEGLMSISLSELVGVKSFEGTRSNIGKTIAMITREELSRSDEHANKYSYVAPFENYIDINNAETLKLNMLTCQVRDTDGRLVQGMYGSTQALFKIRQDPEFKRQMEKQKMLARDIELTGQILSQDIQTVGS